MLKKLAWASGSLVALTALIGLAHMPVARPLLSLLEGVPGCPVLDGVAPEKTEAFRQASLRKRAGAARAASMPAAVFELGQSRASAEQVIKERGVGCQEVRSGSVIRCNGLRLDDGKVASEAHIQFDGAARLVAVDLHQTAQCSDDAIATVRELTGQLVAKVGPVTTTQGVFSDEFLTERSYRRAANEFRYRDYQARVVALSVPDGVRLRQTYQWVPPS